MPYPKVEVSRSNENAGAAGVALLGKHKCQLMTAFGRINFS
jgi:hypothetical protein